MGSCCSSSNVRPFQPEVAVTQRSTTQPSLPKVVDLPATYDSVNWTRVAAALCEEFSDTNATARINEHHDAQEHLSVLWRFAEKSGLTDYASLSAALTDCAAPVLLSPLLPIPTKGGPARSSLIHLVASRLCLSVAEVEAHTIDAMRRADAVIALALANTPFDPLVGASFGNRGQGDDDDDDAIGGQGPASRRTESAIVDTIKTACKGQSWDAVGGASAGGTRVNREAAFHSAGAILLQHASDQTLRRLAVARLALKIACSLVAFLDGRFREGLVDAGSKASERKGAVTLMYDDVAYGVVRRGAQSRSISALFWRMWHFCGHPARGMEAVGEVEASLSSFSVLLCALGVLSSRSDVDDIASWIADLPFSLLDGQAKRVVAYYQMLLQGQRKLGIKQIHRSELVGAVSQSVDAWTKSVAGECTSAKLFPTFFDEAGEGHGPRKELFEAFAEAVVSDYSAPQRMPPPWLLKRSSSLTLSPIASSAPASSAASPSSPLLFEAIEGRAAMTLVPGSRIPSAEELSKWLVAGNRVTLSWVKPSSATELEAARVALVAVTGTSASAVFRTSQPFVRDGVVALTAVEPRHQPLFTADDRRSDAWFAPSIREGDLHDDDDNGDDGTGSAAVAAPFPHGSRKWLQRRYFCVGWLLGSCLANGTTFPIPLPAVLFKMLRTAAPPLPGATGNRRYVPTEADLLDLRPSLQATFASIRAMTPQQLREFVSDDEDLEAIVGSAASAPLDPEMVIRDGFVKQILRDSCRFRLEAVYGGFQASGLTTVSCFHRLSALDLQEMICGERDDGESDFSFDAVFNLQFSPDFAQFRHTVAFRRIITETLNGRYVLNGGVAEFKRQVLRFITGCARLPPKKVETISVVLTGATGSLASCSQVLSRLPAAHTCANSFEVPNYLEALLLSQVSRPQTAKIDDSDREAAWSAMDEAGRTRLRMAAAMHLQQKLSTACESGLSYELDETSSAHRVPPLVAGPLASPPSSWPKPPLSPLQREDAGGGDGEGEAEEDGPAEQMAEGTFPDVAGAPSHPAANPTANARDPTTAKSSAPPAMVVYANEFDSDDGAEPEAAAQPRPAVQW